MPGEFLDAVRCDRIRRLCAVHPDRTVAELAQVSSSTVYMLRKRNFRPARRSERPVPNDWGIVAPGRSSDFLRAYYSVSPKVLRRWRLEKPVQQPGKGHNRRERPADLREVLDRMTIKQAEAHYQVSNRLLCKWRREIGLTTRFDTPINRSWVEQRQFERQAELAR